MKISNLSQAREMIDTKDPLDLEDSFQIAQICACALRNPQEERTARDTVIRVLDDWKQIHPTTHKLWNDIVESAGLYPYVDPEILSGAALIRLKYNNSKYLEDLYFHEEQNDLAFKLLAGMSIVLSAPTSFGKSLLIEEIIASKKYSNIVIIQPTLALLDETRKKLHKYHQDYKLIVSTTQIPSENTGNIFLFTGERVVEYPYFKAIDFFVIDEFYKLSLNRDDDRAIVLNHALYKLMKFTDKIYLLGPMIKSIPEAVRERYEINWIHTSFATVAVDEIKYTPGQTGNKEKRKLALFKLLIELNEPTLIYCAAPQKATDIAIEFMKYIIENASQYAKKLLTKENNDIVEWLQENIHLRWSLIETLKYAIAFHHGALPRHLGSSIVDAYNNGGIIYLFCTSTLIEGVNTTAKNVILFDKKKGIKLIDFFDYRNIAGRSGRMNVHFVGRVFKFHAEPEQMELEVDIPIITQSGAPPEILIQLDKEDLLPSSIERLSSVFALDSELFEIIKRNSGISIEGQLNIIHEIESNLLAYNRIMRWYHLPSYKQLLPIISLAWNNLLRTTESKANVKTPEQLTFYTISYINLKSIKGMISEEIRNDYLINKFPDIAQRIDKVVFAILNNVRHWFDYKLPKWLGAVSSLQQYVFRRKGLLYGDYTYLASVLENGFLPKEIATLLDLDVPLSALRKLRPAFPAKELKTDEIIKLLGSIDLRQYGLISYELKKISKVL